MLSVNGKSHVVRHMVTSWFFCAPKICAFGETLKTCAIILTPWVELNWWGHMRELYTGVIIKISDKVLTRTLQESNMGVSW